MRIGDVLHEFNQNVRGNISVLAAASMLGAVALTGAAVDYARALSVKTALQSAADATAIMLAQNINSIPVTQMQTKGSAFLQAAFYRASAGEASMQLDASQISQKRVGITAHAQMPTTLTNIIGYQNVDIKVTAQAIAPQSGRHRIALVLDNSGSMKDDKKMEALQSAATRFLTGLQDQATTSDDVYVSIVPFNEDVNLGKEEADSWWIDWTDWDAGFNATNIGSNGKTKYSNRGSWNGCVNDRGNSSNPSSANYDTNVVSPKSGDRATYFSADNPQDCPEAIMSLSNDFSALIKKVKKMGPKGNTNQGIGLAHGWMSLVGGGPYPTPPAEDPNYTYQKTIILLSDGRNTVNRWYTSENAINTRQRLTCDNIKASEIMIFAIQVNTDSDPSSSVLQYCASDRTKFFQLSSAAQMDDVFENIGGQLNALRLIN